jgi:hypothetical protein
MWPGVNSPGMPADPFRMTAPIRPRASWYLLPCVLMLAAVVELVIVVILNYGGLRISDDPEGTGSAAVGARIYLVEGHHYFVYVENSATTPTTCAVDGSGPVALTTKNSWSASTTESVAGRSYRYTASFRSPVTGAATVSCQGVNGGLMVKPDDTSLAYFGAAIMVAGGLTLLAFIAFLVVILRRSGAKRAALAASRPFKGPYG